MNVVCRPIETCVSFFKSKRMKWAEHVACNGEERGACRILVGKPDGRPRRRWEDNIKMDLR
jgi:hypothetical protein